MLRAEAGRGATATVIARERRERTRLVGIIPCERPNEVEDEIGYVCKGRRVEAGLNDILEVDVVIYRLPVFGLGFSLPVSQDVKLDDGMKMVTDFTGASPLGNTLSPARDDGGVRIRTGGYEGNRENEKRRERACVRSKYGLSRDTSSGCVFSTLQRLLPWMLDRGYNAILPSHAIPAAYTVDS